jgi:hypothetical protein
MNTLNGSLLIISDLKIRLRRSMHSLNDADDS